MRRMNRGSPRSNRGIEELVQLALGLGRAGCQQEDLFYQNRLRPLIQRLLIDRREETLRRSPRPGVWPASPFL